MSAMAFANLPPARSRRLAIVLAILAVVVTVAAIALPVWMVHRHYDAALAESNDKLARYGRIADTRPAVAKQLETVRAKEARRFFLRSGAPALSAAEAQEALRAIVEGNGGRLITMQPPTAKEEVGRYRQISVNVQL